MSFVGAGGKTRAIVTLARELEGRGWSVLATTTTRVGTRIASAMTVIELAPGRSPTSIAEALSDGTAVFLAGGLGPDGKYLGPPLEVLDDLATSGCADVILVEADGARGRSLKAPAPHEPVIPASTTLVVPTAGLDVLGRPLGTRRVHRIELVRAIAPGSTATPELVAAVVASDRGGLKGVPHGARVRPMLTKWRSAPADDVAATAHLIIERGAGRIDRVVLSDLGPGSCRYLDLSGG